MEEGREVTRMSSGGDRDVEKRSTCRAQVVFPSKSRTGWEHSRWQREEETWLEFEAVPAGRGPRLNGHMSDNGLGS